MKYATGCTILLLTLMTATSVCAGSDQASGVSAKSSCPNWQAKFDSLSSAERELVIKYGVIQRADWVISPGLVADCEQRERIENYLAAAMTGNVGPSQREFVHRNGPLLFRVLTKIWPELGHCAAVPSDGAFDSEKWGILKYSGLSEPQLADLLRESLRSEGLGDNFTFFVLSHPIPALKGDVARELKSAESVSPKRNVDAEIQVYCLALLYSLGQKDVADRLERLRADDQTTVIQKKVITSLLSKIKDGANITWPDIEEMDYDPQL